MQEMFDRIVTHLSTQRAKAENADGDCQYFDPKTGRKCALGCLISAPAYSPAIEGRSLNPDSISVIRALNKSGYDALDFVEMKLLRALQSTHDNQPVNFWPDRLKKIAQDFALDASKVPDTLSAIA